MNKKQCDLAKDFIEENSMPVPESGCWIWEVCQDHGRVRFLGGSELLNSLVFEAYKGPVPKGQIVTHQCHVEGCVNPVHLRLLNINLVKDIAMNS
ncbi:MAG: HNH endonuclease [Methylococcaceae bacterium]